MLALSFQEIVLGLHRFWSEQGCLLAQPYDVEKGAGTMNPATFFRCLGPEPWNVAYVEPSRRPADGRYGENPNRLGQYWQYQVVLKPSPEDVLDCYLRSLAAIGIRREAHDIRFVEDNWEWPAGAAWGLGWEVWCDGMEITQFTYFQQCGGQEVRPVAAEITYGLERLAMFVQGARDVFAIRWAGDLTYGDVFRQAECEFSRYAFEVSDPVLLRQHFDAYEGEARRVLDAGLCLPAYDFILKCSHTFNLLDARGAVAVAQRAAYIGRMQRLSRQAAALFVRQRTEAGFPLLRRGASPAAPLAVGLPAGAAGAAGAAGKDGVRTVPVAVRSPATSTRVGRTFLLEVGVEELPARYCAEALAQLQAQGEALLRQHRLPFAGSRVLGTPRRLAWVVEGLADRQLDAELVVRGPAQAVAFGPDGAPSAAARGFARTHGVPVEALTVEAVGQRAYVFARRTEYGAAAVEVLAALVPDLVAALQFPRTMRWGTGDFRFPRPIRWLVALWGEDVVPCAVAGVSAGRQSSGHRTLHPGTVQLDRAEDYVDALRTAYVLVDRQERHRRIADGVAAAAAAVGGRARAHAALLDEVTDINEWPTAFGGGFDPAALEVPEPVLVTVMRVHQRYFPVESAAGDLLPRFVGVRNGGGRDLDVVVQGNERVLAARFADARFFYDEDRKQPLHSRVERLDTISFAEGLGTLADKSRRLSVLAATLARTVGVDAAVVERAAGLCKADRLTHLVAELPELEGTLGGHYAALSGEQESVALAIAEHVLPRAAADELPHSGPGRVLALADRLDSLAGNFLLGRQPTGSADPMGLRRAAAAVVRILEVAGYDLSLLEASGQAMTAYPEQARGPGSGQALGALLDFFRGRLETRLQELGYRHDVVDAVLAVNSDRVADAVHRCAVLATAVGGPGWEDTVTAFKRAANLARQASGVVAVDEALLVEPAETVLWQALGRARLVAASALERGDYPGVLEATAALRAPVDAFLQAVLVMAEDRALRSNRLALLAGVAAVPAAVADLARLTGGGA